MESPTSIRKAILRSVTIVMIAVYGLGSVGVYLLVRNSVYRQFERRMAHELEEAVDQTEREWDGAVAGDYHELAEEEVAEGEGDDEQGTGDDDDIDDEEEDDEFDDESLYFQLWAHDGATLLRSPNLDSTVDLPMVKTDADEIIHSSVDLPDGRRLHTASMSFQLEVEPVEEDDQATAEELAFVASYDSAAAANRVHLTITDSDAPVRRTLGALALAQLLVGLLIAAGTALLMSRLVRRIFRPIDELAVVTAEIRPSDLNRRLPTENVPEELLPLVTRFNALLGQVERALQRERRFATDISHELRNPVAELRSLAEVAMVPSNGDATLAEDPQVIYADMAGISKRLGSIIDVLTDLHRAQSQAFNVDPGKCAVDQVLLQAVEALGERAKTRQIAFDVEDLLQGAEAEIVTDGHLLRSIVDNLLGNALAHSPRGSTVVCRLQKDESNANADSLRLVFSNPVDSFDNSDLEHLREPFWRKDSARNDQDHFGLGLSLVDAYAKLLGAKVEFAVENGEFVATVILSGTDE